MESVRRQRSSFAAHVFEAKKVPCTYTPVILHKDEE